MSAATLESQLAQTWPPAAWQEVTTLVAVSGGADSVALLRAMVTLKTAGVGRLAVAHFNHGLRGADSAADEAFVRQLCQGLGLPCEVGHASPMPDTSGGDGREGLARRLRYDFFQAAAERWGARYLATAHTADDQAETILHRILRGTGIAGLAGIARVRVLSPAVTVIRPMLGIRRAEVLEYLQALGQSYRLDRSNLEPCYTRNRIRLQLLPELARYNSAVQDAILRLGGLASEVQQVVDGLVDSLYERSVCPLGDQGVCLDLPALVASPPYLLRELLQAIWHRQGWPLQAMGYAQWEALAGMLRPESGPGKQVLPGQILAVRTADQLLLRAQ